MNARKEWERGVVFALELLFYLIKKGNMGAAAFFVPACQPARVCDYEMTHTKNCLWAPVADTVDVSFEINAAVPITWNLFKQNSYDISKNDLATVSEILASLNKILCLKRQF